jgi:predicted ATPase/DNA-binding XRE family transcriptional regulator
MSAEAKSDYSTTDFGALLQRFRLAVGLSREALAERAGLSATGIGALERGQRRAPHADTVRRLSEALGLDPDNAAALATAVVRHRPPAPAPTGLPASLTTGSGTLIAPLTPLIGRGWDLAVVCGLLRAGDKRLVTLTGTPGVGKTRLALEVVEQLARDFPQPVVLVDLAQIREPREVLDAIAERLGMQRDGGQALERLVRALQGRSLLMLLDNFEQVTSAARDLPVLLAGAPGLRLLVTSRRPLGLRSEHVYAVPPLEVPDLEHLLPLNELAQVAAVRLFLESARAVMPTVELTEENARAVAELCVRLDGLPLAIILAASKTPLLSPQMILERIGQRLSLLRWEAPDLPERQRTLVSAIAWSYDMLGPGEQALFRRLGVFVGGFTLEAAEAVMATSGMVDFDVVEGLSALVAGSLVLNLQEIAGHRRYGMLESIRDHALERLAEHGELEATSRAHAAYFVERVEQEQAGGREGDQHACYSLLEVEWHNLCAARRWLAEHPDANLQVRLAMAPASFWSGDLEERRSWLETALRLLGQQSPVVRAEAAIEPWIALGETLILMGELDWAHRELSNALIHARALGNTRIIAMCLVDLGWGRTHAGAWNEATQYLEEGLAAAHTAEDRLQVARAQIFLGEIARLQGRPEQAMAWLEDALLGFRAVGQSSFLAATLSSLALVYGQSGDRSRAAACLREGLEISGRLRNPWLVTLTGERAALASGHSVDAAVLAELLGALETLKRTHGLRRPLRPSEQPQFERLVGELESRLGTASFRAAWEQGTRLSFAETMAVIRQVLDRLSEARGNDRKGPGADVQGRRRGQRAKRARAGSMFFKRRPADC